MSTNDLILKIVKREEAAECSSIIIDGVPIYRLIRFSVRTAIIKNAGYEIMNSKRSWLYGKLLISNIVSIIQIFKILVFRRKFASVFYAFPRTDKVNGVYLDKFTDPIIEECKLKDYIIFDHGRGGEHLKPRIHQEKIVYVDFLHAVSIVYSRIANRWFCKKHQYELDKLAQALDYIIEGPWNKKFFTYLLIESFIYTKLISIMFKQIGAKRIAGPARGQLTPVFIAAKLNGMKTYEFQHGITYSESVGLSGREVPEVEPDVFFAFGDNNPKNVYGIDPQKMVNIGWAFLEYLNTNIKIKRYKEKDVLIISEPQVTVKMIDVVKELAESFPQSDFYFRPHPHEILTQEQIELLKCYKNVYVQDNTINIMEVLYGFNYIVGESSTVLYEALSLGKKVGKVFMMGLNPLYLQPADRDCFWEIHSLEDFKMFLDGDHSEKKSKSIYSNFDKELFMSYFK